MPDCELTTMVMIHDESTGKVLVQDRLKSWHGLAFPGGHVNDGESIVDCAIREIKEETGLDIDHLKACGLVHLIYSENSDRYLVFLFKTSDFSGELVSETDEGRNYWVGIEELAKKPFADKFDQQLPLFFEQAYHEAFSAWNEEGPLKIIYK